MSNAARRIDEGAATQETGTVTARDGDLFVVEAPSGQYRARRAAGCFLCPAVGDLVLVASTRRASWVLSVLERDEAAPARVELDGDLELSLPRGRLSVAAREGVELTSGAPVSVVASAVNVHAPDGALSIERLSLFGGLVQVDVAKARFTAGAVDQVVERVSQRFKRVVRFVEDFEELRAGRIDYAARTLLNLHGRAASVTADVLVKVDGEQVHIG